MDWLTVVGSPQPSVALHVLVHTESHPVPAAWLVSTWAVTAPSQLSLKLTGPKVNWPNGVLHGAVLSVVSPLATGASLSYFTVIDWLTDVVLPQPSVALHVLVNIESQPSPFALVVSTCGAITPSQLSVKVALPAN